MTTLALSRRLPWLTPGLLAWIAFLAVLLAIGGVAAAEVLLKGLEVTNLTDAVPWGLWITIDLSAIALGAGAFTLSAVGFLFGLKRFQSIVRLAVFIGFIGYTTALLTWSWISAPRPLLASLGLLECPLGAVGDHLVHHDLPTHLDR
jgi:hypothetical protein